MLERGAAACGLDCSAMEKRIKTFRNHFSSRPLKHERHGRAQLTRNHRDAQSKGKLARAVGMNTNLEGHGSRWGKTLGIATNVKNRAEMWWKKINPPRQTPPV